MHNLASELRQRATLSESLLWEAIRNRQIEGYKFRRQVHIGGFVVDFYCAEQKLAIEVDGSSHRDREQEDRLRQQAIEALGIRFLRFSAEQVETDLQSVLMEIRSELG
ncbi:endonuclease domain-containing protein [Anaerolineae bacterium CFX9]|nr:endonuclease domain-containing protein [Anaerolineae bacterium CFX9]